MQIIHETDDLLILDHNPPGYRGILAGFLAVAVAGGVNVIPTTDIPLFGVGMIIVATLFMQPCLHGFSQRRQVILDRRAGTVTLRGWTIFGCRRGGPRARVRQRNGRMTAGRVHQRLNGRGAEGLTRACVQPNPQRTSGKRRLSGPCKVRDRPPSARIRPRGQSAFARFPRPARRSIASRPAPYGTGRE